MGLLVYRCKVIARVKMVFVLSNMLVSLWRRWQHLVHGINETVATVLMVFTYVLAVTPVSLVFKGFVSDPIDRGLGDPHAKSYWKPVEKEADANDIRRVQRQY